MPLHHRLLAKGFQVLAGRVTRPPAAYDAFAAHVAAPARVVVPTDTGPVTVHVYRPPADAPGTDAGTDAGTDGAPPVYVNLHGGGFVARHPEFDAHICRVLAAETGCVVVNVDYDVAPQRPFPVAAQQAYAVAAWAATTGAREHGWDGGRLAVGGQSAGGNLAASACLRARDEGGFEAALQVLVYPPLDLVQDPGDKHARTAKPLISPGLARVFNHSYVPDPARLADPLVSPLHAGDLAGLPPALVVTADHDLLRDEGDRYAERLAAAGVPVRHHVAPGVDHAFTHVEPTGPTRDFLDVVVAEVGAAWARTARPTA
ncbi:alpha/beta hydrolase [Kineosporia sp. A_224]|uniref:alpha/beta hydrolase n=1 Tax=Kineosporia sp. A_224 TaxID=1962180 RepID=UPI000B4ADD14|nr:alpha/beta hydrolase [Kineosporia sp. A_224]